jgi:hypothetical protein
MVGTFHVLLHTILRYFAVKSKPICNQSDTRECQPYAAVGDNKDDRCSDSNGAGKTTLVMAPMWALTGQSDLRVEGGASKTLTKTDVVNDGVKAARVRLEGTVDGEPFWVERRVSRAKLLSLKYGVGDEVGLCTLNQVDP